MKHTALLTFTLAGLTFFAGCAAEQDELQSATVAGVEESFDALELELNAQPFTLTGSHIPIRSHSARADVVVA